MSSAAQTPTDPPAPGPDDIVALFNDGLTLLNQGRPSEALARYDQVLVLAPAWPEAHHNRAVALAGLGRHDEALAGYDHALALRPDYAKAHVSRGLTLNALGRHDEALAAYARACALRPDDAQAFYNRGLTLRELGRHDEALARFERAIALAPDDADAFNHRGVALRNLGRREEALASFERAIALRPDYAIALDNRGLTLLALGRPGEALAAYERLLALAPDQAATHNDRGVALEGLKRHDEALASFERAIVLRPDYAKAHENRGVALNSLKRYDEALASFERAGALDPDEARTSYNRGVALRHLNRLDEALAAFERAIASRPDDSEAINNRGVTLQDLRRYGEALASYDRALALRPGYAEAHYNRGVTLQDMERFEDALASYDRALALRPGHASALNNRGVTLQSLKRYDEALGSFEQALATNPSLANGFNGVANCAMRLCDWDRRARYAAQLVARVAASRPVSPFVAIGYSDDPALQRRCNEMFAAEKIPAAPPPLWTGRNYRHEKIRIAYLSADFQDHATAVLSAGLYELHDRARFEVIAISFGPQAESRMKTRLVAAFDGFHEVAAMSDRDIARLIRDLEIDIAIDLKGYTEASRPAILAHRPAPVQVSYLGYPATMAVPFIDYVIADPVVLPFEQQPHWSEAIVHLPDSYQVNDSRRRPAGPAPSRRDVGLPDQGFVFCSFNNSWKITPPVFDVWMRLLRAVPGSVLWLIADNAVTRVNLQGEARRRGIDPSRLVFAEPAPLDEHLARQRLADLFLDTAPCNAHTTASDALWAGLPVLTCPGQAFAGRVAASLLTAAGLPELIAASLEDYEAKALRLATDPGLLADLKARLARDRATCPLFDTARFTRHIEAAYGAMWQTCQRGEPPGSFAVAAMLASDEK